MDRGTLLLASDQFLSIYGRLLDSIHRIKNQLDRDDSKSSQNGPVYHHAPIQIARPREMVPRDTDYYILDQSSHNRERFSFEKKTTSQDTAKHAGVPRLVPELALHSVAKPRESEEMTVLAQYSPTRQSEVFDNLLMRLDRLKETLDLDRSNLDPLVTSKTSSPPPSRRNEASRSGHFFEMEAGHQRQTDAFHYHLDPSKDKSLREASPGQRFHELSPIGLQIGDASMEDQSKNEILAIIDPSKNLAKEPLHRLSLDHISNLNKPSLTEYNHTDLEYSASKKESYQSQIDNFLTNETHFQKHHHQKVEETPTAFNWMDVPQNSETRRPFQKPNDRKKLVPMDDNISQPIPEKMNFKPLKVLEAVPCAYPEDKENQIHHELIARQPSPGLLLKRPAQIHAGTSSPYFAKLMRDYGIRHQEEEAAFQRREQRFQQIKNVLDKEERLRSKDKVTRKERGPTKRSRSRGSNRQSRDQENNLLAIQDRISHIDQKINLYEFTFKDPEVLKTLEDEQEKRPRHRHTDSAHKQSKSSLKQSRAEEGSINNSWGKRNTKHTRPNSRQHVFENWTEEESNEVFVSMNNEYSSVKSVKPPISFEIPIDNQKTQQSTDRSTLKDAYSKFVARKSQKNLHRPTQSSFDRDASGYASPIELKSMDNRPTSVSNRRSSVSPFVHCSSKSPCARDHHGQHHQDHRPRKSGVKTEVEISLAKHRQQKATAKKRVERIKTYDASRRNIR